jgi:hypothetical protein
LDQQSSPFVCRPCVYSDTTKTFLRLGTSPVTMNNAPFLVPHREGSTCFSHDPPLQAYRTTQHYVVGPLSHSLTLFQETSNSRERQKAHWKIRGRECTTGYGMSQNVQHVTRHVLRFLVPAVALAPGVLALEAAGESS